MWIQANAQFDDSWGTQVRHDLVWLQALTPSLHLLPHPFESTCEWEEFIRENPPRWKRLVKAAVAEAPHDIPPPPLCSPTGNYGFSPVQCKICHEIFRPGASLSMHMQNKHKYRALAFYYLNVDGACRYCLKVLHDPYRLRNHLDRGNGTVSVCLRQLVLGGYPINNDSEVLEIQSHASASARRLRAAGRGPVFATKPAFYAQGALEAIRSGPIDHRGWAHSGSAWVRV